ncbi:ABC transporter ATP-binding protein [Sphingoaurantiacus capsulatus]|uniref:ABC transporter ATP-binding protein n=1 Tax=Sphingoaurantiacus capsulatus TaxID=1771310 RepID=A0ABV7XE36_9SPHN
MDAAVEARGLVKRFGDRPVVDGVDLTVPKGAIFGFLGQNGAGKTTTLRMLLGILEPDGGERTLLGEDRPLRSAHRVGYLPEERGLYPAMSAREAIAYMGALRGLPWAEGRRRADELLTANGLGAHTKSKIRTLSKGMAQKVQLLATIVHQPDLVVLDEPFSGLDPVNQEALEQLIRAERARGATILFSTHVMAHAERLCDELVIIAHGRTRFTGSVDVARRTLPTRVSLAVERPLADAAVLLPPGFGDDGAGSYRFDLPKAGLEPVLRGVLDAGAGVRDLHVERPRLHDAFMAIVADEDAK